MVKQQTATFRGARPIPPAWAVRFDVPIPPAPGMYMLADLGGPLRMPLFPSAFDSEGFVTVLAPGHPALKFLPGTEFSMLGPLGHGFHVRDCTRLLLVAEAPHLPPLLPLLNMASEVVVVVEATTRAQLPAPTQFPPAVELLLVTLDGSVGYLGPLESDSPTPQGLQRANRRFLELLAWTEKVCFAFDPKRYPALAQQVKQGRLQPQPGFAQAIVRTAMPCGVGVCEVCRIRTRHGEKRACVDGPVFDLLDLDTTGFR